MAIHDPLAILTDRFRAAIAAAYPHLEGPVDPLIAPGKQASLGDFQCNAAMSLAKRVGQNPRQVAQTIVARADLSPIADPLTERSIAGPGFINVRLRPRALADLLEHVDNPALGVDAPGSTETVVVDLCGVNLAKQMHVGHLRATVIGDALARLFERLGHRVIRQNHVGDWGLPIAMVTHRLMGLTASGAVDGARLTLDDLDRAYRDAKRECEADEEGLEAARRYGLGPKALAELEEQVAGAREAEAAARQTLVRLQRHDPDVHAAWKRIADVTMAECIAAFRRLGCTLCERDSAGESSYSEELAGIVDDLVSRGVAEQSDGALVVRVEGIEEPCLVRKRDGGFLYATSDLAGIRRRVRKLGADRVIYTVDARQSLHFAQVFAAARKAGYTLRPGAPGHARLEHAAFGTILGEDGRPFKSRSGENVKLSALIDEAAERCLSAVRQRSPDLPEPEQRRIAEAIGIAAIKFADLCNDRARDYTFSFDRMLAFEGFTGPYLLYALVRVRSIFRKAQERGVRSDPAAPLLINDPAEKTLALALLRYPASLASAAQSLEPHRVCQYLYELAGAFATFFDACPVLQATDSANQQSRLRLCDLTGRVLADGLHVLGIPTLDRM
ncbi:MAG: arginine--tRNA ligase [Phycisphaerae bacterium]|nr:arginine--tRNA ligase [Phycisphaerae bacterium]